MSSQSIKEKIKEQYKRCAQDPAYFMRKYCKIQHPIKGSILFELYPFQEETLHQFRDNDYNIVLKSRQMGISTLVAGYSLWLMLFHSDKNILIIATKQDTAKGLVTKVRVMHDFLPSWLKGKCTEDNRLSLRFSNGSQIKAESSAPESARGSALSLLILDECAFIETSEDIWLAAAPALSTGGAAILLSTPSGIGNFFHKMWMEAEEKVASIGGKAFNPICLKWNLHPERDQKWRDEQDKLLGKKDAGQECDCDFLSSGNSVVDMSILLDYKSKCIDPIEKRGFDRGFWIWKYPDYNRQYVVSADVARGDGEDYSAFHVIDVEGLEQVAEYRGKIDTRAYGNLLIEAATLYNDALLAVENSNIGWDVCQHLIDRNYKNLFYSSSDLLIVDTMHQLTNKHYREDKKLLPGFSCTMKSRPLIISKLEAYMRENTVIINSIRTIDEFFTFVWNGSKAMAMRSYNDDLIMALGYALWLRDTALRLRTEGILVQKQTLDGITRLGDKDNSIARPTFWMAPNSAVNPYEFKINNNSTMDLRELL